MADLSAAIDGALVPFLQQGVGAVMGGVVGGFAGFIANRVLDARAKDLVRKNVAAALAAEIDALRDQMSAHYLPLLRGDMDDARAGREVYHRYRGGREYMPIYRSLGIHVGLLPNPLPRDLAAWYADFTILLERARELHDLFDREDPATMRRALKIADIQCAHAETVLREAEPLIERLSKV